MAIATRPANLEKYAEEVIAGLVNEKARLDSALENMAYYDRDAERYRQGAGWGSAPFPLGGGAKDVDRRSSGLTRELVDVLCEHLYGSGGPTRMYADSSDVDDILEGARASLGNELLQRVYTDTVFNAVMLRADKLSTLNDVCALQVDAGEGTYEEVPFRFWLWGGEEFTIWTDPRNCLAPVAVCTIERFDLRTRYKLWSAEEVRTYETAKATGTAGGRVAREVAREENTYGRLPFSFVHFDFPVSRFWTPAPGTFIRKAEVAADRRLVRIDEALDRYLDPIPLARNVPADWQPLLERGRFLKLPPGSPELRSDGYDTGTPPDLNYLQAQIDVLGAWEDLDRYLAQVMEAVRIPRGAVSMQYEGAPSGVSILVRQAPLLSRARTRRMTFQVFEQDIATCVLECAMNHYGRPDLEEAVREGHLSLAWPEPNLMLPGTDRDENDRARLQMGLVSRLMLVEERNSCSREQAIEILKQVRADRELEDVIDPELEGLTLPAPKPGASETPETPEAPEASEPTPDPAPAPEA